jgi:hypothetical protein
MLDFYVPCTVGKLALPNFARFQICGNPSLGPRDMVPRTGVAGVFLVRSRTIFRSGFRLDPVKSWRSESSMSCMSVSSFQRARACGSTCCESRRLCAQAWQRRWGKFWKFQHSLISSACFYARGRRSSRHRILTILVLSESLRYLLFNGTGFAQRRAWVRKI